MQGANKGSAAPSTAFISQKKTSAKARVGVDGAKKPEGLRGQGPNESSHVGIGRSVEG